MSSLNEKKPSIFSNKTYTKLFLASFASEIGNVTGMVALVFYFLERFSNQPSYATLTELMYSLPTIAVFLFIGVVSDRFDRQKIALYSDWLRATLTIFLLLSIWTNLLPLIFLALFIRSGISKFFMPAQTGLIQGILDKESYTTASGINQMMKSVFLVFGNGLGAITYWTIGIEGAILIDALSFIISGILIYSCKIEEKVRIPNGLTRLNNLSFSMLGTDFIEGCKYVLKNRLLLSLMSGLIFLGVVNAGLSILPLFIMKYKLVPDTYEQMNVYLGVISGVGILIGSIIATKVAKKIKLYKLIIAGFLMSSILISLVAIVPNIYLFFILFFFVALSFPVVNVAFFGWLLKIVEPKMMGRVQGLMDPIMMSSQSLTLLMISLLFPNTVEIETLFLLVALSLLGISIYYIIALPNLAKKQEQSYASNLGDDERKTV